MQTPYIYSTKGIFLLRRVSCIKVFSRQSTLSDLQILYSIKISLRILYSIQIVFSRSDAVGGGTGGKNGRVRFLVPGGARMSEGSVVGEIALCSCLIQMRYRLVLKVVIESKDRL
jgi:hypothetical protein